MAPLTVAAKEIPVETSSRQSVQDLQTTINGNLIRRVEALEDLLEQHKILTNSAIARLTIRVTLLEEDFDGTN
jgi:hypothetical protein